MTKLKQIAGEKGHTLCTKQAQTVIVKSHLIYLKSNFLGQQWNAWQSTKINEQAHDVNEKMLLVKMITK